MWTQFFDIHSGGGTKEKWSRIYIEAPQEEATLIFYNRFGHNPHDVACACCGNNYSVMEHQSLEAATGYHRRRLGTYQTLYEYEKMEEVLIIRDSEIQQSEREGYLPDADYSAYDEYE